MKEMEKLALIATCCFQEGLISGAAAMDSRTAGLKSHVTCDWSEKAQGMLLPGRVRQTGANHLAVEFCGS